MGIESGSPRMLARYNKKITPNQTKRAFATCWNYGIRPCGYIIIGHPDETLEDIKLTAELIKVIQPSYIDISILAPIPGTQLYKDTAHFIDRDRLKALDNRHQLTVFRELRYDLKTGLDLLKDAYEASRRQEA